jgi:uncharacterized membrane protein
VNKIKGFLRKYFITGLLVLIPLWATYYVLSGLLSMIDGILGDLPSRFTGFQFPGLGIITLLLLILLVGVLSANYIGTRLVKFSDRMMQRVPIVSGIYSTVKQIMETFSVKQNFHGVGLIEYPRKGCYSLGFITAAVHGPHFGLSGNYQSIFIPTTPNPTAGFLLILPENEITRLDMTVEQGMKFIISLGLVTLTEGEAQKLKQNRQEASS